MSTTTVQREFKGEGDAEGAARGQDDHEFAARHKVHPNQVTRWKAEGGGKDEGGSPVGSGADAR